MKRPDVGLPDIVVGSFCLGIGLIAWGLSCIFFPLAPITVGIALVFASWWVRR